MKGLILDESCLVDIGQELVFFQERRDDAMFQTGRKRASRKRKVDDVSYWSN